MKRPVVPDALATRARAWRHDLHRIPETAFREHETSAYVARVLGELGYIVETGIGGTGLVASLTRGTSGRTVGLRSELDALPIAVLRAQVLQEVEQRMDLLALDATRRQEAVDRVELQRALKL